LIGFGDKEVVQMRVASDSGNANKVAAVFSKVEPEIAGETPTYLRRRVLIEEMNASVRKEVAYDELFGQRCD
jgi:hypothetical protein